MTVLNVTQLPSAGPDWAASVFVGWLRLMLGVMLPPLPPLLAIAGEAANARQATRDMKRVRRSFILVSLRCGSSERFGRPGAAGDLVAPVRVLRFAPLIGGWHANVHPSI